MTERTNSETHSKPARILVADDEPLFRETTARLLRNSGYECVAVEDANAAIEMLDDQTFDLVISDLHMPGNLKLELLHDQHKRRNDVPMIIVTGVPSLPTAIDAMRLGITDYLLKPIKPDALISSVERAIQASRRGRLFRLETDESETESDTRFPTIIGESPAMRELKTLVARVARVDTSVLITGESGTGKEIVAEAIHRHSPRQDKPFQIIDCTAIPESLFESVLFGHKKGAFTGAVRDEDGLLKQCDEGTAFFDELGELPLPMQAKLLRAVQQQTFTPVGSHETVTIDTRFVCATNRDLELEVQAGRFRQDLFYRLGVLHMELPPLRSRDDDVVLLARHFLAELRSEQSAIDFDDDALTLLRKYDWPGNIRELRNVVERSLVLAEGERIQAKDLPANLREQDDADRATADGAARRLNLVNETSVDGSGDDPILISVPRNAPRDDAIRAAEHQYLTELLQSQGGNVSAAAELAGLSRQGLHKLLKQHGISASQFRD